MPGRSAAASAQMSLLGYEADLWRMADALRGSMDAAADKHVVLSLLFREHRTRLAQEPYADPEDPGEYRAANVF